MVMGYDTYRVSVETQQEQGFRVIVQKIATIT